MQGILYVISAIFMLVTILLVKKTDNKISFIKNASLALVIKISYNVFVSFILSNIHIESTLVNLSIISILISALIWIFLIRKNGVQKQSFSIKNTVATIFITALVVIVSVLNFGSRLDIKYVMTDSAVHYSAAHDFYDKGKLVEQIPKTERLTNEGFMPGAYVTTGIWFKVLSPIIGEMNLYKIFILSDILMLWSLVIILYSLIEDKIDSCLKFILTMLMLLLFVCGYPLNSMIFGYCYLQMGIIMFAAFLNVMQIMNKENAKFDKKVLYTILMFINFETFFSYCLFAPVLYIAELICLFRINKVDRKNIKWSQILWLLYIYGIPVLCGLYYLVLPHILYSQEEGQKPFFEIEGYIYRNIWGNFVLLTPLVALRIKKKDEDGTTLAITLLTLLFVMVPFLIATYGLRLSTYYYYKYNFVLWFLLWYGAIYAMLTVEKVWKKVAITYISMYAILAVSVTVLKHVDINKEQLDSDENITTAFDVYGLNKTIVTEVSKVFDKEQMNLVNYVYDNLKFNKNEIMVITTTRQQIWLKAFFVTIDYEEFKLKILKDEISNWNDGKIKYLFVLYDNSYWTMSKDQIKPGKVLFENEAGIIYENNLKEQR